MSDDIEQTRKRNADQVRQGQQLLDQANSLLEEHAQMFERLGITREGMQRYMESEHVKAEHRTQCQAEVEDFVNQIDQGVEEVEQEHKHVPRHPGKHRMTV